ncbi:MULTISPECIES: hypothetical protein [Bacillaceae]|uniref:hypothetical protein n=1 Tax=Bacillaceae TaxID=186817 RepID=UPI001E565259|nr:MULTISPECIES: hypothetical protein [Bacillaceae]MCE4049413.1 hypothetical protein [Bacillus sp. Au-Bac7]UPO90177.1 hypothetical protein L8T27_025815 [Niallia sp. Man26]
MKKLSTIGKINLIAGTLFVLMGILAFFSGYLPGSFFVEMEPFLFIPIGLSLLLSASSFQKADGN